MRSIEKTLIDFDTNVELKLNFDGVLKSFDSYDLDEVEQFAIDNRKLVIYDRTLNLKQAKNIVNTTKDMLQSQKTDDLCGKYSAFEVIKRFNNCGFIEYRRGSFHNAIDFFSKAYNVAFEYQKDYYIPDTFSNFKRSEIELFRKIEPKDILDEKIKNNLIELKTKFDEYSSKIPNNTDTPQYYVYNHGMASLAHNISDLSKNLGEKYLIDRIKYTILSLEYGYDKDYYREVQSLNQIRDMLSLLKEENIKYLDEKFSLGENIDEIERNIVRTILLGNKAKWVRGKQIIYQSLLSKVKIDDLKDKDIRYGDFKSAVEQIIRYQLRDIFLIDNDFNLSFMLDTKNNDDIDVVSYNYDTLIRLYEKLKISKDIVIGLKKDKVKLIVEIFRERFLTFTARKKILLGVKGYIEDILEFQIESHKNSDDILEILNFIERYKNILSNEIYDIDLDTNIDIDTKSLFNKITSKIDTKNLFIDNNFLDIELSMIEKLNTKYEDVLDKKEIKFKENIDIELDDIELKYGVVVLRFLYIKNKIYIVSLVDGKFSIEKFIYDDIGDIIEFYEDISNSMDDFVNKIENTSLKKSIDVVVDKIGIENISAIFMIPDDILFNLPLHLFVDKKYNISSILYSISLKDLFIKSANNYDDFTQIYEPHREKCKGLKEINFGDVKKCCDANKETLKNIEKNNIVFSCHGYYNNDYPYLSSLVLHNDIFTVIDILSSHLEKGIIALFACNSGKVHINNYDNSALGLLFAFLSKKNSMVFTSLRKLSFNEHNSIIELLNSTDIESILLNIYDYDEFFNSPIVLYTRLENYYKVCDFFKNIIEKQDKKSKKEDDYLDLVSSTQEVLNLVDQELIKYIIEAYGSYISYKAVNDVTNKMIKFFKSKEFRKILKLITKR